MQGLNRAETAFTILSCNLFFSHSAVWYTSYSVSYQHTDVKSPLKREKRKDTGDILGRGVEERL